MIECYFPLFQASANSSFPRGPRGGFPEPIVQRRRQSVDDSESHHVENSKQTSSWSFFTLGNSRNKRKLLPSGKDTVPDFSCRDRPPGYYADMKLGCEVSSLNFGAKINVVLRYPVAGLF